MNINYTETFTVFPSRYNPDIRLRKTSEVIEIEEYSSIRDKLSKIFNLVTLGLALYMIIFSIYTDFNQLFCRMLISIAILAIIFSVFSKPIRVLKIYKNKILISKINVIGIEQDNDFSTSLKLENIIEAKPLKGLPEKSDGWNRNLIDNGDKNSYVSLRFKSDNKEKQLKVITYISQKTAIFISDIINKNLVHIKRTSISFQSTPKAKTSTGLRRKSRMQKKHYSHR